jgi:formate dehydrogenase subunit gamma
MRTTYKALRAILCLVLFMLGVLLAPAAAAQGKNDHATPAYAEEQTMLQVEADSRVPDPGLLSTDSGRVHMDRHYLGQYGTKEGNVIVQRGGNTWRHLRNGPLATLAGFILLGVPLAIFVFYKTIGPATPPAESGRKLKRFNRWERVVHWATAFAFVALGITGLIIMYGKKTFLPWMGHDVFSWVAIIAKYLHNFVGPLFVLCSILMFFTFLSKNFFNRADWLWVKKGGGLFTHEHIPAGFFNAGEKTWFWGGVALLGLVVSVSGLMLDFAVGQTRYVMQVANVLHVAGAALYMTFTMGHAFIGTIGTPGAYEAMRHGTVDENWAKMHHRLWYEQMKTGVPPGLDQDGNVIPGTGTGAGAPTPDRDGSGIGPRPQPGPAH